MPAHVIEHYLDKRVRYVVEHCARGRGPRRRLRHRRPRPAPRRRRLRDERRRPLAGDARRAGARARPTCDARARRRATELPFEDDSFDLVLASRRCTTSPIPTQVRATLAEMVRVARPGGDVLVWDHNPRNPYWKRLMAKVPQDDGSERLIPEAEVVGGLARRRRRIARSAQLGLRARLRPGAPDARRAAGRRAARRADPRCCGASAPTTSCSRGPDGYRADRERGPGSRRDARVRALRRRADARARAPAGSSPTSSSRSPRAA